MSVVDLSCGLETKPVLWEPGSNIFPPDFRYVTRSIPGPGCDMDTYTEQLTGCNCQGSCDVRHCPCLQRFSQSYDESSHCLLATAVDSTQLKPVFECNRQCKCDTSCHNRLVQHGPKFKLRVKDSETRGLGLFACEDIRQLEFICEYAGEVVGAVEARERLRDMQGDMNYLIVLREHCAAGVILTCVDPRHVGNVGRFANHSCDPNMLMVPVRVDHGIPRLALFARRNIAAGEELTFDYSGETLLDHAQDVCEQQDRPVSPQGDGQKKCLPCTSQLKTRTVLDSDHKSYSSKEPADVFTDQRVDNSFSDNLQSDLVLTDGRTDCKVCQQKADGIQGNCECTGKVVASSGQTGVKSCGKDLFSEVYASNNFSREQGNGSCMFLDAHHDVWKTRKRKLSGEELGGCDNLTGNMNKATIFKHATGDENSMQSTSHVNLRKKCLCGSRNCKQYLPYDEQIFSE